MRHLLKNTLINLISIYTISALGAGLVYASSTSLFLGSFCLAFSNAIIKPLLKLLFTPLNVITFGLSSWLINVLIVYSVTWLIPGISIQPFALTLLGTTYQLDYLFSLILISFGLSLITSLVSWLLD